MKVFVTMLVLLIANLCWALEPMTAQQALPLAKTKAEEKCSCTDLQLTDIYGDLDINGMVSNQGSDGWTFNFYSATAGMEYPTFLSQGSFVVLELPPISGNPPINDGWIDSNRALGIALNARDGWLRDYTESHPETTFEASLVYFELEDKVIWNFGLTETETFYWINAYTGDVIYIYVDPLETSTQTWQSIKSQAIH